MIRKAILKAFDSGTYKATVELEAEESGTLVKVFAPAGDTVAVPGVVAVIGDPAEPLPDESTLTRAVVPVCRSCTKMSCMP